MSLQPMDFQKSDKAHLGTWKRVCRIIAYSSMGCAVLLLLLAFFLL